MSNEVEFEAEMKSKNQFSDTLADELFCTLFDDLNIVGYVETTTDLSESALQLLKLVVSSLDAVANETPSHIENKELLENSNFRLAQKHAADFLHAIDAENK